MVLLLLLLTLLAPLVHPVELHLGRTDLWVRGTLNSSAPMDLPVWFLDPTAARSGIRGTGGELRIPEDFYHERTPLIDFPGNETELWAVRLGPCGYCVIRQDQPR